jgi:hypothetical protein
MTRKGEGGLGALNLYDAADKAAQVWAMVWWFAGENSRSHQQLSQQGAKRRSRKFSCQPACGSP